MAFSSTLKLDGDVAKITLEGDLNASVANEFKQTVEEAAAAQAKRLVLYLADLQFMASAGLRVLIFAKQKMGREVDIYVIGSQGPVLKTLEMSGFHHSVYIQDTYEG